MNVYDLADKIQTDALQHEKRGVRKRATKERCYRVALRAMSNRDVGPAQLADMCAAEERGETYRNKGYGSWLMLLLPILRILFQYLAERAQLHLRFEGVEEAQS